MLTLSLAGMDARCKVNDVARVVVARLPVATLMVYLIVEWPKHGSRMLLG